MEGGGALVGDPLADDIGLAGVQIGLDLLRAEIAAGVVSPVKLAGVLLGLSLLAEAVIGRALGYQQMGVFAVQAPPLRLDVGAHRAAHVGAFVVIQAALGHGAVDDIGGAFHQTALVGILNAQDERAVIVPGDEPGIQGGAQVAHVHVAGGGGGEPGADAALGDAGLHLVKESLIDFHKMVPPLEIYTITHLALWPLRRRMSRKCEP